MKNDESLFGEVIFKYTLGDAISDGVFINVNKFIEYRETSLTNLLKQGLNFLISEGIKDEVESRNPHNSFSNLDRGIIYEDFFDTCLRVGHDVLMKGELFKWKIVPTMDLEGDALEFYGHFERFDGKDYYKVFLPREL